MCSTTLGGTPAHCDAERISAGVQSETLPQLSPNSFKSFQIVAKSFQILPNPSPDPPKPSPNPPKMEPTSIQKASWSLSWTNALKKLVFECQKYGQEAPKSAQETSRSLPEPSQMEPKTFPNPIFKLFFTFYFPIPKLHRFFWYFCSFFCQTFKSRILKNSGFS